MVDFSALVAKSRGEKADTTQPVDPNEALKKSLAATNEKTGIKLNVSPAPANASADVSSTSVAGAAGGDLVAGFPGPQQSPPAPPPVDIGAAEFVNANQPETMDNEAVIMLQKALEILLNHLDDKALVSDALRNILQHMQTHPFLKDMLRPDDYRLMVAGLRKSYGVAIAKKQKRQTKKKATDQKVEEVMDMLAGTTFSI